MTPWEGTGLSELAARASEHDKPVIGLVDGPVDASHPALAAVRVEAVDGGAAACSSPQSPACRHGTFVAGQLAGLGPRTTLVTHSLFCEAERLDACPMVAPQHLAAAIEGLLDRGVRIINLSVGLQGGPAGSMSALRHAYARARELGVLVVAAAGNDARDDANPLFRDTWVIPVAAHDDAGVILPTSNRGGMVAMQGLLAPGHARMSPGGGETRMSGTSMAAPLVTAAAALLWSLHPQATAAQLREALLRPGVDRRSPVPPRLDLAHSERWLSQALHSTPPRIETSTMMQSAPTLDVTSLAPGDAALGLPPAPPAAPAAAPVAAGPPQGTVVPQGCACGTGVVAGFVYSAGRLELRFPDAGVRKEFEARARELGVAPTAYYAVLSRYRYLARRMCWVLSTDQQPAGILVPEGEAELTDLIAVLEHLPSPEIVVTGRLANTAPASACDGLMVPMVPLTEVAYFTQPMLLEQIAKQTGIDPKTLAAPADRIWQLTGVWRKPGFDDEQRAANYIVLRTTSLYELAVSLAAERVPFWLQRIESRSARTETGRSVVYVDSTFQNVNTQTQTWRAEVDVTDLFPFLTKALFQV